MQMGELQRVGAHERRRCFHLARTIWRCLAALPGRCQLPWPFPIGQHPPSTCRTMLFVVLDSVPLSAAQVRSPCGAALRPRHGLSCRSTSGWLPTVSKVREWRVQRLQAGTHCVHPGGMTCPLITLLLKVRAPEEPSLCTRHFAPSQFEHAYICSKKGHEWRYDLHMLSCMMVFVTE
jgi:hypothetical protein